MICRPAGDLPLWKQDADGGSGDLSNREVIIKESKEYQPLIYADARRYSVLV